MNLNKVHFTILGAGTWGIALGKTLVHNNCQVSIWHYKPEYLDYLNQKKFHNDLNCSIPESINFISKHQYIDKESCEAAGECDDDDYTTQEECEDEGEEWEDAGLDWQTVNHGFVDYTDKEKCEAAGYEWQDVEYFSQESCEAVGACSDAQYTTEDDCDDAGEKLRIDDGGIIVYGSIETADLILSNESQGANDFDGTTGSWQIQEGSDDLFIMNKLTGKKYKFKLEKI